MSLQIFQDNINAKLAAFRDEGWPFTEVEVMREGCGKASSWQIWMNSKEKSENSSLVYLSANRNETVEGRMQHGMLIRSHTVSRNAIFSPWEIRKSGQNKYKLDFPKFHCLSDGKTRQKWQKSPRQLFCDEQKHPEAHPKVKSDAWES